MNQAQARQYATKVAILLHNGGVELGRRSARDQSLMGSLSVMVAAQNKDVDAFNPHFHEIILFGSAAGDNEFPGDVDLMAFDRGFYSNVLTTGNGKADYRNLQDNLSMLLTGWFGYQGNEPEMEAVTKGYPVDLLVFPLDVLFDTERRKQVATMQSDPNFFENAFACIWRFDSEMRQFVKTDLAALQEKHQAAFSAVQPTQEVVCN